MRGLPIQSYKNATPQLLIGINNKHATVPLSIKEGRLSDPVATLSRLGWTIHGTVGPLPTNNEFQPQLHICECDNEIALQKLVLFNMKHDGPDNTVKEKMKNADLSLMERSVKREDKRYIVQLLWKEPDMSLPDNFSMAMQRLECLERKLRKDRQLLQSVKNHIKGMVAKGYIRKLNTD